MRYTNINPVLTTEILERAGFNFDGYYYVNPDIQLRFNVEGEGFKPSFVDPTAPRFNTVIKTYSDLIRVMHNMLQYYIGTKMSTKQFTSDREAQEYVVRILHQYYGFDKELNFMLQFAPGGFIPIANNEYTYTLLDGRVNDFELEWKLPSDENLRITKFQTHPQCVSYPYLLRIIQCEFPEINDMDVMPVILEVKYIRDDGYTPFFGAGIPTIPLDVKKNAEQTEKVAE
jgi:hypothetical protein